MIIDARGGGGGNLGWVGLVLFAVFAVLVIATSVMRMRRGGPGPRVGWVPRPFRQKLNEFHRRRGWPEPFDAKGDRNPFNEPL